MVGRPIEERRYPLSGPQSCRFGVRLNIKVPVANEIVFQIEILECEVVICEKKITQMAVKTVSMNI